MKKSIKYLIIIVVIIVVGVAVDLAVYFSGQKIPLYDFAKVEIRNVVQEVSVTGQVKPAQKIGLAFEQSGKVSMVSVGVGDTVAIGQMLASLDDRQAKTQIVQGQANVASSQAFADQQQLAWQQQQIKLTELKNGARPEDVQISQTRLTSAQNSLQDAQTNLQTVVNKNNIDLMAAYASAIASGESAVNTGKQALYVLTDIQLAHFYNYDMTSENIANAKTQAIATLLGGQNAGRWTNDFISQLSGGASQQLVQAKQSQNLSLNDVAITQTILGLGQIKSALQQVPLSSVLTSLEINNLLASQNGIDSSLAGLQVKQDSIANQKNLNQLNFNSANARITEAQNQVASSQADLNLKLAGASVEQIASQEMQAKQAQTVWQNSQSQLKQTQANLSGLLVQLDKYHLISPVAGLISRQDLKVGQIASPNLEVVTIISAKKYQLEANIAEVDIAKIKIGNPANLTLDAYGQEVSWQAKVVKIDPAETLVEGVATYKVTLELIQEDERIKSGMTANINILTNQVNDVLAVPQRAVITQDNKNFVRILSSNLAEQIPVTLGLRGSDGFTAIIAGLQAGQQIIVGDKAK